MAEFVYCPRCENYEAAMAHGGICAKCRRNVFEWDAGEVMATITRLLMCMGDSDHGRSTINVIASALIVWEELEYSEAAERSV